MAQTFGGSRPATATFPPAQYSEFETLAEVRAIELTVTRHRDSAKAIEFNVLSTRNLDPLASKSKHLDLREST